MTAQRGFAAKALNIRRGAGFQPAMAAFVPPSGSTPAGTPALPARGLLHGWRSSRNLREPKRNQRSVVRKLLSSRALAATLPARTQTSIPPEWLVSLHLQGPLRCQRMRYWS